MRVSDSEADTYVDTAGWSVVVPEAMYLERSESPRNFGLSQVTVASFSMRRAVDLDGTARPPLRMDGVFPEDGVAFRVTCRPGSPTHIGAALHRPEASFPMALDSFEPGSQPGMRRDERVPPSLARQIAANGQIYLGVLWIGPNAPAVACSKLDEVVGSLRFASLNPGQVVGMGFTVFERTESYNAGSFTPIQANERCFLLVHAPGGFYALGWNGREHSYSSTCDHEIDRDRNEIYCRTCAARWDRIGRIINRPITAPKDDWLDLITTKIAWDGHVLVHPNTRQRPSEPNARILWPDWAEGHGT
jgi:hypothetical protein